MSKVPRQLRIGIGAATMIGVALVVMLPGIVSTTAANASSVAHRGSAARGRFDSRAGTASPDTTVASCNAAGGYPVQMFDNGNSHWAWQNGSHLAFYDGSGAADYCVYQDPANSSLYEFWPFGTGECLAAQSDGEISTDSEADCNSDNGQGHADDNWEVYVHSFNDAGPTQSLENPQVTRCIYDDKQDPAIMSGCSLTDQFEYFELWDLYAGHPIELQ